MYLVGISNKSNNDGKSLPSFQSERRVAGYCCFNAPTKFIQLIFLVQNPSKPVTAHLAKTEVLVLTSTSILSLAHAEMNTLELFVNRVST